MNKIDRTMAGMTRATERRAVSKAMYDKVYDQWRESAKDLNIALQRQLDVEYAYDVANLSYISEGIKPGCVVLYEGLWGRKDYHDELVALDREIILQNAKDLYQRGEAIWYYPPGIPKGFGENGLGRSGIVYTEGIW